MEKTDKKQKTTRNVIALNRYKPKTTKQTKLSRFLSKLKDIILLPPDYSKGNWSYIKDFRYPPPPMYWSYTSPPPYEVALEMGVIASPKRIESMLNSENLLK
ncbi:hypothetical protein BB559_002042 [Furculomyces boomerangus]|uniref:Uncharacterized protein n=2 Tax=Harpellales TaxID=61421 RepID=A0A2T9YYJ3_9FUNG|nr:hypothetical protein BB559_002042 [Furculomyces boomerangus]PVZ96966.1 hypothetical protein BB558_007098 [Smittium angustum]PVZ98247.1 hypothetical protein BB558_005759 [Smittium angustum]PWA01602.1 hypothetical protein BB558_002300 [Smittium angustum]